MPLINCLSCGKEIKIWDCLLGKKKFCSRKCHGEWRSINMVGDKNYAYKGGIAIYTNGKKRYKQHMFEYYIGGGGHRAVHRVKAEKAVGRKLNRWEHVHHINGDSLDNRNSNLLVCTVNYHRWLHDRMSQLYMKEHFA